MSIEYYSYGSSFICCASLLLLSGCIAYRTELLVHKLSSPYEELVACSCYIAQEKKCSTQPTITIWIHGTRFFSASIFKNVFQCKPALKPYSIVDSSHKLGEAVCALNQAYYGDDTPGSMWLFGWSGKLSFAVRERAAMVLRNELERVIAASVQEYGQVPYVRIIAHSHGGNVALNLAHIVQEYPVDWHIDELILLACPVQGKTMHNVHAHLFKCVFSLSSSIDVIQLLDPQWIFDRRNASAFFSKRDFPLNTKVTQVRITVNGRGLMHKDFSRPYVLRLLPLIIDEILCWKRTQPPALATWWHPAKKLLSIYTNGRQVHPQQYRYKNEQRLRRLAQRIPLSALDIRTTEI